MARMPKVALPASTPSDSPLVSICVNRDWLSIMHTCLTRLEWGASWRDGTDIDQAEQMTFELYDRLRNISSCGNDMARLRQNPNNSCQLQQSFDGGITWELAFDFSKCRPKPDRITEQNFYNQTLEVYESVMNLYDGSVTSVAPDMVYTGDETADNARDIAICYAVHQLVDWACEIELEYRKDLALGLNIISGALVVTSALVGAGIIVASGGTGIPVALSLGSAIASFGASLWGGVSEEILRDYTAREKVACCLYNAIKGQTPTATLFENGLSGCNFAFGSPEAQLAGAISAVLGQDDVHATFLKYTSDNLRFAELGLIDCPCPTVITWEHEFNFALNNGGWNVMASPSPALGVWSAGQGWMAQYGLSGNDYQNRARVERVGFSSTTFTSLRIEMSFKRGTSSISPNVAVRIGNLIVVSQTIASQTLQNYVFEWSGETNSDRLDFRIFPYSGANTSVANRGELVVRRITVRGTGTNPFI